MYETQRNIATLIHNKGIKLTYLSQKTGIKDELLRRALNGSRKMSGDELVKVCKVANIEIADL